MVIVALGFIAGMTLTGILYLLVLFRLTRP